MKKKSFSDILDGWYAKFEKMKPGDAPEEVFSKKNPALFIDICKSFIDAGHPDFEFTNDYRYFKRINNY